MNEIEKMYKLARIKPIEDKIASNQYQYYYPPFTPEKQLNIIKFLGETRDFYTCGRFCSILNCEGDSVESLQDNFEESLANLINTLWRNLTSEEKQQIKEILE